MRVTAWSLVQLILVQSGLFVGHGLVDVELRVEKETWVRSVGLGGGRLTGIGGVLTVGEERQFLLLDCLLRVSHMWNVEYCLQAAEALHDGGYRCRGLGGSLFPLMNGDGESLNSYTTCHLTHYLL